MRFLCNLSVALTVVAAPALGDTWLSLERNPIVFTREAIQGAKASVDVVAYKFNEGSISKALRQAIDRGVQVRMLVDWDEARRSDSRVRQLLEAGAEVRAWRRGKLHAKFMIVDDSTVVTGSFNWTESAQHKNVELLIELDDPAEVNRVEKQFEELWQLAEPVAA